MFECYVIEIMFNMIVFLYFKYFCSVIFLSWNVSKLHGIKYRKKLLNQVMTNVECNCNKNQIYINFPLCFQRMQLHVFVLMTT